MPTIDEKRVYTDNAGTETVYLATGLGVVAVAVSDDLIGEFGIAHRCAARDVATAGSLVAVATDETVLLADRSESDAGDAEGGSTVVAAEGLSFAETGFGPATAVGFDDGALVAGDGDGRVARLTDPAPDTAAEDGWTDLGTAGSVRAVDGGLVAAADGVYRIGSSLTHAGLDDARDVDAEPLAATGAGLYKLGNGWMDVLDGAVDAVDAAGERAQAVRDGELYVRTAAGATQEWRAEELPVDEPVAAVAHGIEASYAVTEDGTFAVRLPDGEWRYRGVGVRDVVAAAV
ncbi:HVO_0234 family beta-propeller protein [Halobellus sp. EA9]|uniref:HVO_0234 family beta-propeller protein n=1 Tax=Halobellus sp. EA9 TaxID=3421647 RepID=UPI003EBF99C5